MVLVTTIIIIILLLSLLLLSLLIITNRCVYNNSGYTAHSARAAIISNHSLVISSYLALVAIIN